MARQCWNPRLVFTLNMVPEQKPCDWWSHSPEHPEECEGFPLLLSGQWGQGSKTEKCRQGGWVKGILQPLVLSDPGPDCTVSAQ